MEFGPDMIERIYFFATLIVAHYGQALACRTAFIGARWHDALSEQWNAYLMDSDRSAMMAFHGCH